MKIAIDAMGTDNRPQPDVAGAVLAAREYGDTLFLIGDQARIERELDQHDTTGLALEIIHAPEEIVMHDKPSAVMKSKPQSSMHIGLNMVKDGTADGFVSMGNTGAAHAIATLSTLRRIPGVKRPALTVLYPINDEIVIMLDVGANADSKVEWLQQFAMMGSIYAEQVFKRQAPRVHTLSNGEEEGKGNQLVKAAQVAMQQLPINYRGHIEPKELMETGTDVLVMDGFVGNIFIKTYEASLTYLTDVIREEIKAKPVSTIGGLLTRGAFARVRDRIDTRNIGGAPLLGVNGIVIIGHGSADAHSVRGAINQARLAIEARVIEAITDGLAQLSVKV